MTSMARAAIYAQVEQRLVELPAVVSQHHSHVWSIDGEKHVFTTHLVMRADASRGDIVAAKEGVRSLLDPEQFEHVTVDVELEGEACASKPAAPDQAAVTAPET